MQNGHPLVVHFPIAFLTIATLLVVVGAFARAAWIPPFARACLYFGTLAASFAVISGFFAAQTVAPVAGATEELETHQTFGYVTLGLAFALSAWSIVAWRRTSQPPRPAAAWWLGNVALLAVLVFTAMEGGELVHDYGVGTRLTGPEGPLHETPVARPTARDSVPTARDFR